jgi:hypothetical protein
VIVMVGDMSLLAKGDVDDLYYIFMLVMEVW